MLASLPSEILESIAYELILDDHTPPVSLLCTCRSIYDAVSPETNPNVYAHVFKDLYDVAAAERRLGPLTSANLVAELRTRYGALGRWSERFALSSKTLGQTDSKARDVAKDDPLGKQTARALDSWVVFLMLIENGVCTVDNPNTRWQESPSHTAR